MRERIIAMTAEKAESQILQSLIGELSSPLCAATKAYPITNDFRAVSTVHLQESIGA